MTAPVEPAPAVDVPKPLTEPRRDWDDDPRTCARFDDRYWDDRYGYEPEEGADD